MRDALARLNPRFLAHVADAPADPLVLRLDSLLPEEVSALVACAASCGALARSGPRGALVQGSGAQHAALTRALIGRGGASATLGRAIAATAAHQHGAPPAATRLGRHTWRWGAKTYVMGIVNVSPDSFSGDGLAGAEAAVAQGRAFAAAGADILDVGGESTRPGHTALSTAEELARVIPVLRALREAVALPLSIDTCKAAVAAAAVEVGATMINDVTALRGDPALAGVAARSGAALVLMHNRPAPVAVGALGGHNPSAHYDDLLGEVLAELRAAVGSAARAGVAREQILIDPGIGFGKTREQNLALLARLGELRALGRPILLGTSRKSVIGLTLNLPPDQRVEGTAASVALGIRAGADVVRVHDVAEIVRVARASDTLVRGVLSDSR